VITKAPKKTFLPRAKVKNLPSQPTILPDVSFKSPKRVQQPKASLLKLQKRFQKKRKRRGRAPVAISRRDFRTQQRSYVGSEKGFDGSDSNDNDDRSGRGGGNSGSGGRGGNSGSGRGGGDDD
jgi:hypothetical protein